MLQIEWLKTIEICPLTVLKAKSPKSSGQQGHNTSEWSGENSSCFFQFLELLVFFGLRQHSSNLWLCPYMTSFPLPFCAFFFWLIRKLSLDFGPALNLTLISILIISVKTLFPNKSHSRSQVDMNFEGHYSRHQMGQSELRLKPGSYNKLLTV